MSPEDNKGEKMSVRSGSVPKEIISVVAAQELRGAFSHHSGPCPARPCGTFEPQEGKRKADLVEASAKSALVGKLLFHILAMSPQSLAVSQLHCGKGGRDPF